MIKVSVLVPVYGVEKYIERCARSLFEQTMSEGIEYIFVNDCTKDKSIEILENIIEKYPERKPFVRIIYHDVNKGLASARNTGLDNAAGEYVCMVDSDDYINPKMLEVLYEKAINTGADIVTCNFLWQFEKFATKYTIKKRDTKHEYLIDILDRTAPTMLWSRLYKRLLIENNSIRIPENIQLGEDMSIIPRLFYLAEKVDFIDEYLYHYVQYNSSSIIYNFTKKHIDDIIAVFNILDNYFKDKTKEYIEAINYNKLFTRLMFICGSRGSLQQYAGRIFLGVETKKNISKLPLWYKVVYFLSFKGKYSTLNMILNIRLILGKIKRGLKSRINNGS